MDDLQEHVHDQLPGRQTQLSRGGAHVIQKQERDIRTHIRDHVHVSTQSTSRGSNPTRPRRCSNPSKTRNEHMHAYLRPCACKNLHSSDKKLSSCHRFYLFVIYILSMLSDSSEHSYYCCLPICHIVTGAKLDG